MIFLFWIILIFTGMFVKKSKIYDFLIIIFIAIITYYGGNIADLENYQNAYNYIASGNYYNDLGVGWYFLCVIGVKMHLTYIQFKTIVVILSMLLVNNSIKYFLNGNEHKTIIWALYLIFPILLECIQVRFFIAESIVLYSMKFLMNEKKKYVFIYILLVLLAATIHSSMLIYLIFLLYRVLGKYESKYVAIISAMMFIFFIFKKNIIKILSLVINQKRINRYFYSTDSLGIKGFIIYIFIILIFYYIAKMMLKKAKETKQDSHFFEFMLKQNILISILLVFSIFDPNFFRLQRIMWVLTYVGGAKLLNSSIKEITIFNIKTPIKLLLSILAIIGNLIFISITTPEIITLFLM